MPKICPLFSSSEGNSVYVSGSSGALLVDCGVSCKAILNSLNERGIDEGEIKGILITHSHTDHTRSLKALANRLNVPVFATAQTVETLESQGKLCVGVDVNVIDDVFDVAGIEVTPFETSHDAEGSVGYSFLMPDLTKISVCTDLGVVTDQVRSAIKGSNALLIESNHDLTMLKNGPYPPELKIRIMGEKGHLSNVACAAELPDLLESGTTRFILGHLSRHNNQPPIAKACSESVLIGKGARNGRDYLLSVAPIKGGEMLYL